MIRFLHAADLHLDSQLRGLEKYEGAPVERIRLATRRALENLVKLAIEHRVHFVVLAGDIYDGDWTHVGTGLFFVSQMARLKEAGIPVFLIAGNHDAANKMTRTLPYPNNVRIFPHERPGTFTLGDIGVALHGQSYANPAEHTNLAIQYPGAVHGMLNIGLLHTSLSGREGHEPYAPCMVEELRTRNYDYWALGHVHQRESVNEANWPRVEYPGNVQGRHIREVGAKGCLLATANGEGTIATEFHPLDVVRWGRVRVDCEGAGSLDAVHERVAAGLDEAQAASEGRTLLARVELFGCTDLHTALAAGRGDFCDELRAKAIAQGADAIWLEKVVVNTRQPEFADPTEPLGDDAISEIAAVTADLFYSPEKLQSFLDMDDLVALAGRLPVEMTEGETGIRLGDPAWARGLLATAREILVSEATAKEARR